MRKAVGVILLILVVSVIVYIIFYSPAKNGSIHNIDIVSEGEIHKAASMRQIDSLTADLNYEFTIKNKVVHTASPDSIRIPQKRETPSG